MFEYHKIKDGDRIDFASLLQYIYSPETNLIHNTNHLTQDCLLKYMRSIVQGNTIEELNQTQAELCPFCT